MNPDQLLPLLKQLSPVQIAQMMMTQRMGLDALIGVEFKAASSTRVTAQCLTSSKHLQPYGLIHGGLYCSLGESLCSIGGFLQALPTGKFIVGRENKTRFHRGARKDALLEITAQADPNSIEGHLLWNFEVKDAERRCASGSVLLALVDPKKHIDGEQLELQVDLERQHSSSFEVPHDD